MRARRFGLVIGVLAFLGSAHARATEPTKLECIADNARAQDARREAKFSEARALLASCASASCPAAIRADCSSRLEQLDAAQPTILFDIKDAAGSDIVSVRISLDGAPTEVRLGSAIPLDPGPHHVTFDAPGFVSASRDLVLTEGEKGRRERIVLVPSRAPSADPSPAPAVVPLVAPAPTSSRGRAQRAVGLTVGAVGIGGLGAGVVLGLLASTKRSDQIANCESSTSCVNRAAALDDHSAATGYATASTVGIVAGGLLLVAGTALVLTAPSSRSAVGATVAPAVAPSTAGLVLGGAF